MSMAQSKNVVEDPCMYLWEISHIFGNVLEVYQTINCSTLLLLMMMLLGFAIKQYSVSMCRYVMVERKNKICSISPYFDFNILLLSVGFKCLCCLCIFVHCLSEMNGNLCGTMSIYSHRGLLPDFKSLLQTIHLHF